VHSDFQAKGIGGKLIMAGLDALRKSKKQLVFVLGHPRLLPSLRLYSGWRLWI